MNIHSKTSVSHCEIFVAATQITRLPSNLQRNDLQQTVQISGCFPRIRNGVSRSNKQPCEWMRRSTTVHMSHVFCNSSRLSNPKYAVHTFRSNVFLFGNGNDSWKTYMTHFHKENRLVPVKQPCRKWHIFTVASPAMDICIVAYDSHVSDVPISLIFLLSLWFGRRHFIHIFFLLITWDNFTPSLDK